MSCQTMDTEVSSQVQTQKSPVELARTLEFDPNPQTTADLSSPKIVNAGFPPNELPLAPPSENGPQLLLPHSPQPTGISPATPRVMQTPGTASLLSGIPVPGNLAMPTDFVPWWEELVQLPIRTQKPAKPVNPESLRLVALAHSPYIHIIQQTPRIREWSIMDAESAFDWNTFVASNYDDTSDPVGNTLTTGGPPRLRDNKYNLRGGFRRKYVTGGELIFSQAIGLWDSNSRFFDPVQQGNSRLELSYSQPLLQGNNEEYNRSLIVLAHIETSMATKETETQLQDHMAKVEQAYWYLYKARAVYVQRLKSYLSAEKLVETIRARQQFDVQQRDLVRAEAAMAQRYSNLLRAAVAIEEAEVQLRGLIEGIEANSAFETETAETLLTSSEMIPQQVPRLTPASLSERVSLKSALYHRPDVQRAMQSIQGSEVRYNVAVEEMRPKLDLLLSTYMAGLQGNHDVGNAWGDQFTEGEPGYAIGLLFDMPLGRRGPNARLNQRELELQQSMMSLQLALQRGRTEVDLALKRTQGAWHEILSRYHAMRAQATEVAFLEKRYHLPGGIQVGTLLADLLDAQDRLNLEEEAFVTAQMNYMLGLLEMHRATGTLLRIQPLEELPVPQPANPAPGLPPAMEFRAPGVEE